MALTDFADLVTAVRTELKIPSGDTAAINKIKLDINVIYLDEVVPFKRWLWLTRKTKHIHKAFYGAGTCSVTPNSVTVTLSTAPAASIGSLAGYKFSTDGFSEVYTVSAHTAQSTTVTLTSAYQGPLSTASAFKFWKDTVVLPTTCREVIEATHSSMLEPMVGMGYKEFREFQTNNQKAVHYPTSYHVSDYTDPSGGEQTESDRYRTMTIHPAITSQPLTIDIDYIVEPEWLTDDGDEPLLPIEDRIVLLYGALSRAWARERNEERAAANDALFQRKLARMAGKIEEGFDKPRITISSKWARSKRGPTSKGGSLRGYGSDFGFSSGGGYSIPTYLENTTINGANVTGNITVAASITIDGRDISVDGAALDAHIASTAAHGATGAVMGTTNTQTVTNKTLSTASNNVTGTATRVAIFNNSGNLEADATITPSMLAFLSNVVDLTTVSLADNQSSAADVFSLAATYTSAVVFYSISRGTANKATGLLLLTNDGTNADIVELAGDLGTIGVTLTADVSGGNVRVRYTSTNTGTAPTFKYSAIRWAS